MLIVCVIQIEKANVVVVAVVFAFIISL